MKTLKFFLTAAALVATPTIKAAEFVPATMDDVEYPADGVISPALDGGTLRSGSLIFNGSTYDYDGFTYWEGYSFSNQTATAFESYADQYHSAPGGGMDSEGFCMAFPETFSIEVDGAPEGAVLPRMGVTNSANSYMSMLNGDAFAKKFEQGDWFKLVVTGHHADGTTADVEYYLADFRSEDAADHYIVNTWEWVDLTPLGAVTSLTFAFDSTDKANGYLNTPQFVCFDNIGTPDDNNAIATIAPTADAPAEWYSLSGIRVARPTAPGIYIRRQGNTASKIRL